MKCHVSLRPLAVRGVGCFEVFWGNLMPWGMAMHVCQKCSLG